MNVFLSQAISIMHVDTTPFTQKRRNIIVVIVFYCILQHCFDCFCLFSANPGSSKPKPAGTDDGFKGEGAACGTSIVKVGSQ